MTAADVWSIVAAVLLVVVAAAFASVEAALSRVSRVLAEDLVREGRRGAVALREIIAEPARYLNVVTLLRITCELVATVLVAAVFLDASSSRAGGVALAAVVMVVLSYVVIGVSPRTVGRQRAVGVGLAGAPVVRRITRVLGPFPRVLISMGNAVTPGKGFREGPFASEAELRDLVDQAQESRLIEDDERAMIHSVFELGDTIVREVMVPRTDMVFVEQSKTLRQALSLALRSGFSRIPVLGEDVDDIVGVVYLKDLARRAYDHREGGPAERIESVMRAPAFVPESKPVDALLREMQADQTHIAIVVDEYGGTAGLVTIEDILEEIVGEIADEYDREPAQVERLSDGSVRVSSRLNIHDLGELFDLDLEDDDVDTVGGLLGKHLGKVPIPGAEVTVEGLVLRGESVRGRRNRLGTVLVRPVSTEGPAPAAGDAPPTSGATALSAAAAVGSAPDVTAAEPADA